MAYVYKDLQDEVKRRATKDQGGTQFDTAVKTVLNTSLFRLSREAKWRQLRRTATFDTITSYTTGSGGGTFTNGSKSVTITGATFITDDIQPGRRITLQGSTKTFTILTITGETTLTIDINYDGTTISGTGTYSILPQEQYNLPVQVSHRAFLWHEDYGYPYQLDYIPQQALISHSIDIAQTGTPTNYHMWGADMVIEQLKEPSAISIASSSASDTAVTVTIFGIVSGYPDYEELSSNGTSTVTGSKSFSSVERVSKSSTSTGRITVSGNSANTTLAVLPVGDTTAGILYRKVRLWPLPRRVHPVNVYYYKDPYRLVGDNDIHELGADFDEALILLATSKINYETSKSEGDRYYGLYKDELISLRKSNTDKIDWFPTLQRSTTHGNGLVHKNLSYQQVGADFGPRVRLR